MQNPLGRAADAVLEGTVVGSFSRIGAVVRPRVLEWADELPDLGGQRAVITGATSGIGRAVADGVVALGANVIVTSRSLERAESVADAINAESGRAAASGMALDTGDLDQIREFAAAVAAGGPLDMLLHNAGALTADRRTNSSGMELTLASHLVGPYLLTTLLRISLTQGARVIWMSSGGMYTEPLVVNRLEMSEEEYRGAVAYARAKRAQVELVAELGPSWAPGIVMHAKHPGWVDTPGVEASLPRFGQIMGPILRDARQGADTMVYLAATGGGSEEPGQFWHDRRPRRTWYLPKTKPDPAERARLVEWLDEVTAS